MRINVITYGERINYGKISANTVIVIDVLRCTSAIVTALDNGAEKVVPVLEPSEAISLAQAIGQRECISEVSAAAIGCRASTQATHRLNMTASRWRGRPS